MTALVLLVCLLTSAGQLSQKQAARQTLRSGFIRWLLLSLLLLAVAMLLWLVVLQHLPVSVAYPMLSLNFIVVAFAARWCWGEKLTRRQLLGTLLIVAGVAILGSER